MSYDVNGPESGASIKPGMNVEERDLVIVLVIAMFSIPSILLSPLNETPLRFLAGVLLITFLPGYALVSAVHPGPRDLKNMERLGLSMILSLAISSVIGLLLAYTVGLITEYAVLSLFAFTLASAMIARRRRIAAFSRGEYPDVTSGGECMKRGSLFILLLVAVSLAAVLYLLAAPRSYGPYTEFVILDPNGRSLDYEVLEGEGLSEGLILEIVNMEYTDASYRLEILLGGKELEERVINLGHGQRYTARYSLNTTTRVPSKLEFLLYKQPSKEPCNDLYLWVYPSGE